ncbi:g10853 [Coccomyxa elongata]
MKGQIRNKALRKPPRNVRSSYTKMKGTRVVKYRAVLPLGSQLTPYRIGDFLDEEEAARAADRAILTFYGRNHPAAVTHFPKETYQEDKRTGIDLEHFLNALSPVSAPSPAATPIKRSSGKFSGKRRPTGACESVVPALVAPGTGSVGSAAASQSTHGAPAQRRSALEAARAAAAMRQRPEDDRPRRAALEALDARLRRLREEQQVSCRLDALTGAGNGEELRLSTSERQQRRIFEADPPPQVAWNTRFTGRSIDWSRPADSRFLVPHDYAADLHHAQRCKDAGVPVVLKREEERLCMRCGSGHHTAKNCPSRVYVEEFPSAGAADKDAVEVPEWAMQLRPELAAVMRSLQRLSGAALARPDMKPFRQLLGSFSPEALLALGLLTDEAMSAELSHSLESAAMAADTEIS